MITPVNPELAKLLQIKEFNELVRSHYKNNVFIYSDALYNWNSEEAQVSWMTQVKSAPTIAEVVMWLYEKHDVWVSVNNQLPRNEKRFEGYVSKVILPPYQHNKLSTFLHLTGLYTSPTEAYEAAIEYTLKNLIK